MNDDNMSKDLADLLAGILCEAVEDAEQYERGLPHVLVCTDLHTEETTFSGPFCNRESAERVAAHERHNAGADTTLSFYAAPLYPPLDLAGWAGGHGGARVESGTL